MGETLKLVEILKCAESTSNQVDGTIVLWEDVAGPSGTNIEGDRQGLLRFAFTLIRLGIGVNHANATLSVRSVEGDFGELAIQRNDDVRDLASPKRLVPNKPTLSIASALGLPRSRK